MTKKKQRQLGTILLLLILLCGLGIGYLFAIRYQEKKEAADTESEITLYSVKESDITELSYQNSTAKLTLIKKGKTWHLKNDASFPVEQSRVETMLGDVAKMTAKRLVVKDCTDLSEYELEEPQLVVTIVTKDGEKRKLSYGLEAAAAGGCYAYMDDARDVYVIASNVTSDFAYTKNQLMELPDVPEIDSDNVNYYKVSTAQGESFTAKKKAAASKKKESDSDKEEAAWNISKSEGKVTEYDQNSMETILTVLEDLSMTEGVSYRASSEERKKYGLSSAAHTVTVKYDAVIEETSDGEQKKERRQYTLYVGKENKSRGCYYVSVKGDSGIYLMDSDTIKSLLSDVL